MFPRSRSPTSFRLRSALGKTAISVSNGTLPCLRNGTMRARPKDVVARAQALDVMGLWWSAADDDESPCMGLLRKTSGEDS